MKRTSMYRAGAIVAALLVLAGILIFAPRMTEGEPPVLRIAVYEWGGYSPVVFAQETGLFVENGLRVELLKASSPAQMNEWFQSGRVDGICGIVLADLLLMRAKGERLQGILITDHSSDGDVLLSRGDLAGPAALKGKRVSVDRLRSFSHVFVQRMLAMHGLDEKDVKLKELPFDQVPDALIQGEIDAGHTWSPAKETGLKVGLKVLASAGDSPGIIMELVAFREELIDRHPDLLRTFTRVFFNAQKQILEDPFQAAVRMKDFFGNEPRAFADSFKMMHFYDLAENREKFDGENGDSVFATARMINDLLLKSGLVRERDLDRAAFRPEFVESQ